jgi:hypothetical protein
MKQLVQSVVDPSHRVIPNLWNTGTNACMWESARGRWKDECKRKLKGGIPITLILEPSIRRTHPAMPLFESCGNLSYAPNV